MNKLIPIYFYGSVVILEGIFLLFSEQSSFAIINFITAITLIIGALFAFIAAFLIPIKQVQFVYHLIHALVMLMFGILTSFLANTIERFVVFTAFLLIFYSVSEIIFCNRIFNLTQNRTYKTMILRSFLGLVIGFTSLMVINFSKLKLESFGVLFVIVGINIVRYTPVILEKKINKIGRNITAS